MPLSGTELSSHGGGGEYRFFRQASRDRLLIEMVGSTKTGAARSAWKVLIMDKVTLKVMSHTCTMADITDQDISLVEDLFKRREPMSSMEAIYFIQPTKENVVMFLSDMSGREPLYRKAYVFFSTHVSKELVNHIKSDTSVLPRIGALREMNLEYFPIDSQAFVTDQELVLQDLYADKAQNTKGFDICLNTMATRISTVFASLNDFPSIRYRAASSSSSTYGESIPQRLTSAIWENLMKYKTIPSFPQTETCDLLILERSVDQIAPVIHEWTYDAMCHDLLEMDGNSYTIQVESKTRGQAENKVVHLDDNDLVWLELRHAHIADASERLHEKMTTFTTKNKAALMQQNAKDGSEVSVRDLQKVAQSLPKYNEVKEKLSLHVEIAGSINRTIREEGLRELGQLEQDLVFGNAGAKDVINFLRTKQNASPENKLRLLMIYSCIYPEKFEGDKALKLMQLAKLSKEDMKVVNNMRFLGGSLDSKQTNGSFSLKFDSQKTKQATRKDRTGKEETWQLFKFYPVIEELVENMLKGQLSIDEYVCMGNPGSAAEDASKKGSVHSSPSPAASSERKAPAHSMRSRRTATWAKQNSSDDGFSSDSVLKEATKEIKRMGRRVFVFIIGGATRSELRACHKLTEKLGSEVILGTSCLEDPPNYITKLKMLSEV